MVVLPAPLGPRKPKTPPSGTSRSSPASAVVRAAPQPAEVLAEPLDLDHAHGVNLPVGLGTGAQGATTIAGGADTTAAATRRSRARAGPRRGDGRACRAARISRSRTSLPATRSYRRPVRVRAHLDVVAPVRQVGDVERLAAHPLVVGVAPPRREDLPDPDRAVAAALREPDLLGAPQWRRAPSCRSRRSAPGRTTACGCGRRPRRRRRAAGTGRTAGSASGGGRARRSKWNPPTGARPMNRPSARSTGTRPSSSCPTAGTPRRRAAPGRGSTRSRRT